MTFPTLTFLVFFAVMLAAHRSPLSWRARKAVLLVGSYVFYAAWNPPFVALLWLSTVVDWTLARKIHDADDGPRRRLLLVASLATNLGLLAFFKYGTFAVENVSALADALGYRLTFAAPDVILPVGISFYTFQTLSYTIDVYRRQLTPGRSFLDYALYVTFFPQLVAGPIVRARHFLPQLEERVQGDDHADKASPPSAAERPPGDQVAWGLSLLVLGLFQKVVLADALLGPVADAIYLDRVFAGFTDAWLGTLAFAGQIFCDFSGYSTCAIGVALALGFHLPDNFRAPYAAIGFSDFWRRWHISLSSWLRDYLYIPLGGSRHGAVRTAVALSATMLLGGLWHGASWTFVAWGALHGLYLVGERLLTSVVGAAAWTTATPTRLAAGLLTFALVCVAWVFFRAEGFEHALHIVQAMAGIAAGPSVLPRWQGVLVACVIGPLLLAHATLRHQTLETLAGKAPAGLRILALALCLLAVFVSPGNDRAFIYFQF
jgi:alginate O-acetyltransferase complex protein AlgI